MILIKGMCIIEMFGNTWFRINLKTIGLILKKPLTKYFTIYQFFYRLKK